MLQKVYGHHHLDSQNEAAEVFKNRRRRPRPLVRTLIEANQAETQNYRERQFNYLYVM